MERILKFWEEKISSAITGLLLIAINLFIVNYYSNELFIEKTNDTKIIILIIYFSLCLGGSIELYISYMWKKRLELAEFEEVNLDNRPLATLRIIVHILAHISFWYFYINYNSFWVRIVCMTISVLIVAMSPKFKRILIGKDFFDFNGKKYVYSKIHGFDDKFGFRIQIISYGYSEDIIRCGTLNRYNYIHMLLKDHSIERMESSTSDIT